MKKTIIGGGAILVTMILEIFWLNQNSFTFSTINGTNHKAKTVTNEVDQVLQSVNKEYGKIDSDYPKYNLQLPPQNLTIDVEEIINQRVNIFPDTPLGYHLHEHINEIVDSTGSNAASRYQASLTVLRTNPEAVTVMLEQAYQSLDETLYLDRWKIVDTLASLESEFALDSLATIASESISVEKNRKTREFSTYEEEVMIRTSAIDGIKRLAQAGIVEAYDELFQLVGSGDRSVQLSAVIAYRSLSFVHGNGIEELRTVLASEDEWMLDLEILSVPVASGYIRSGDEDSIKPHDMEKNEYQYQNPPLAEPININGE